MKRLRSLASFFAALVITLFLGGWSIGFGLDKHIQALHIGDFHFGGLIHLGVFAALLRALRLLPPADRPTQFIGCEVWRDLDWMSDREKIRMDVSGHEALAEKLNAVFVSQIAGGKRYDLAAMGRRVANATFFASHATDTTNAISFAMDLTPLVQDDALRVADFTLRHIENLRADVAGRLGKMT